MIRLNNLTKEELVNLYKNEKESLGDIAKLYNVSRTAIYKRLKKYGLKQRSKSEARLEAQKQGKLPQQFFDINKNFFSSWSPEMAYVLGLLFTDGCVSKTKGGSYSVSLSLIDKDLLEKVRDVMGSKHPIKSYKPQRNLYQQKTKNSISYTLKYGHRHSMKLFSILYKDVAKNMYLNRKYNKFIDGLKYSTRTKNYSPEVPAQEEVREFKRLHNFDFEYKISDLAKRLNVSRRSVERWLSCKTKPSKEKLEGIKRYLDEKRNG